VLLTHTSLRKWRGFSYYRTSGIHMSLIYRQVEVVIAIQTSQYTAHRTLHGEASLPSPDPTREWQVDYVTIQIFPGGSATSFNVLFYRGSTGLGINETTLPDSMVDLGGLRVDGTVRISSSDTYGSETSSNRIYSVTPPRRISISSENGAYKFQTFTSGNITPTNAAAKFVIGLVSSG
jgi:hypothetical protein